MQSRTLLPFLSGLESKICQRLGLSITSQIEGPLITIGGFAGVGKDTLALGLQKRFLEDPNFDIELPIFGSGDFMREYSRQMGYADERLDEFLQFIKNDQEKIKEIDFHIDKQTLEKGMLLQKGIFIGRMSPFVLGSWSTMIWVYVKPEERAKRLIKDPNRAEYGLSVEEVLDRMKSRDESDITRLERIYEVDFNTLINSVDIKIDNSLNTIEETIRIAYNEIIKKKKN
ncbi:MAG: cytidylate kinase-like family protein [Candidatus Hodarchaeales archaeon]|jgi:cytidylate kinase